MVWVEGGWGWVTKDKSKRQIDEKPPSGRQARKRGEGKEEHVFGEDEGVRAGSVHNYIFCSEQYWESIM